MWLQVRWELTMSAFVFLGPAQTKQYLGNISIYDFSEGPGHGHISPFEKLGNVPVVLLCGDDQRPLDIWALFSFWSSSCLANLWNSPPVELDAQKLFWSQLSPHPVSVNVALIWFKILGRNLISKTKYSRLVFRLGWPYQTLFFLFM